MENFLFLCNTNKSNFFAAKVNDLVATAYKTIKTKLPLTLRSMSLYLSNKDTEFILFKPVRVSGVAACWLVTKVCFSSCHFLFLQTFRTLVMLMVSVILEAPEPTSVCLYLIPCSLPLKFFVNFESRN